MDDFSIDVCSLVTLQPRLVSDIVASLRGGLFAQYSPLSGRRWKNVRERDVEKVLGELGATFRYRRSGAGVAVYVGLGPFDVVQGKPVYASDAEAFAASRLAREGKKRSAKLRLGAGRSGR